MEYVGRLDALMRDLLELGRQPQAGEVIECRMNDVIEAASLAAEAQAPEAARRILLEAPESQITIRALPSRLQRALVHLILNALQNSPVDGRVRVRAGHSGGQAVVEVVDEGHGIPIGIRDRLFDPFVTTHTGRRGLGLAMARHYVTAMGGTLEAANNDPPPGATFTVRLPLGK
jgi:signal transduction histidine kinase